MGAVFAFAKTRSSQHRPWQNHELAEFYRAIDILGRTGLVITPDMGVSDEGDPWFAFCRGDNGDVLVHLARIDGLIVATSIASDEIVRGAELRNIIDAVLRIRPLGLPAAGADRRLLLHPAVILTAFIAAALAFSQHAEAHASGAAKAQDSHGLIAKFFGGGTAAPAGETLAALAPSGVNDMSADQGGLASPIPLAALLAAATAVLGPSSDSTALPDPSDAALLQPVVDPASLAPFWSRWTAPAQGDLFLQQDQSAVAATTGSDTVQLTASSGGPSPAVVSDIAPAPMETAQATIQAPPVHFAFSPDAAADHIFVPPPLHVGAVTSAAVAAAPDAGAAQAVDSSFSNGGGSGAAWVLSAISPTALELLLGEVPANLVASGHSTDATQTAAVSVSLPAVTTVSSIGAPLAGSSGLPAIPATINLTVANPIYGLGLLVEYGNTSHPIPGSFPVSSALAQDLATFEAGATGPIKMIVFDSSAITMPVFELTNGVLLVSDQALGITPAQAPSANVVTVDLATGGTMTLLGVVDTPPPTH